MNELRGLKDALAFSVSMIASEHWISASMSSPWSVAKFAKSDDDQRQVWELFKEAAIASLVGSAVIGWLMGDFEAFVWSIVGAGATLAFVGNQYQRALEGTL